jgi:hypothetical protein
VSSVQTLTPGSCVAGALCGSEGDGHTTALPSEISNSQNGKSPVRVATSGGLHEAIKQPLAALTSLRHSSGSRTSSLPQRDLLSMLQNRKVYVSGIIEQCAHTRRMFTLCNHSHWVHVQVPSKRHSDMAHRTDDAVAPCASHRKSIADLQKCKLPAKVNMQFKKPRRLDSGT